MRFTIIFMTALTVNACTVLPKPEPKAELTETTSTAVPAPTNTFSVQLAEQLVNNSRVDLAKAHVAVTDLVGVQSSYNNATAFAQVMSEQLRGELAYRQVPIIDYKTTEFIRVTPQGDFALTRDYLEIDEILPITHVVVGTYSHYRDGVLASARLVDINNKHVVSTGSVYIPSRVIERLDEPNTQPIIR
ncbi:hypothetical protein BFR57_02740 [Idiomarina sp. MD25a]|uniref:FlgO family outer membrane protein n=1 Tax=Idiomarina sp. MD25a TaxID=1889913 RepID=UPI0008F821A3|nr:FlgO family outer membrane protein [Idiomarina sp. MD25a]OIM99502.1 hypothetical protein BFR57_02740 [Idiomarina sp. MD25a]